MENIILFSIPLEQLEKSIAKVLEDKLQSLTQQQNNSEGKKYATRDEVANMLHISKPTLNHLTKTGILTSYRIGSRILYDVKEVESSLHQIITTKYKRN